MTAPSLRRYQSEAIDAVRAAFEQHRSTLLVLATGLGKTVTFSAIAARCAARGYRMLVVAHREELLEQAANTLRRFGLNVGLEQGSRRVDRVCLPQVTVASIQTLRGARLLELAQNAFHLIVIDEAHHATAASYRTVLEHFARAKVLGVTATPTRADKAGLGEVFETVAYRLDLRDGIEGGWLAPLELRTVRVKALDISTVRTVRGDLDAAQLEAELLRDGVLHEVAAPLAELSGGRQTLAFVAGVKQAHALAEVLGGYGVRAAAVDGSMSREQRSSMLSGYREGRLRVVCNAMLWTEGFDAPETSCVALVRPTRSQSLVVQMIGRGTRLSPGKSSCLVLDFVPGTLSRVRLAGPADALAGEIVPDDIAELVRAASAFEATDLGATVRHAREAKANAELAAEQQRQKDLAERRRVIEQVGVEFVAPRLSVDELLQVYGGGEEESKASFRDLKYLRKAGFDVPDDLGIRSARLLRGIVDRRRDLGLCTVKQGRKLRGYGLRDDISSSLAGAALTAIAANGWKPPRSVLLDPRFGHVAATGGLLRSECSAQSRSADL